MHPYKDVLDISICHTPKNAHATWCTNLDSFETGYIRQEARNLLLFSCTTCSYDICIHTDMFLDIYTWHTPENMCHATCCIHQWQVSCEVGSWDTSYICLSFFLLLLLLFMDIGCLLMFLKLQWKIGWSSLTFTLMKQCVRSSDLTGKFSDNWENLGQKLGGKWRENWRRRKSRNWQVREARSRERIQREREGKRENSKKLQKVCAFWLGGKFDVANHLQTSFHFHGSLTKRYTFRRLRERRTHENLLWFWPRNWGEIWILCMRTLCVHSNNPCLGLHFAVEQKVGLDRFQSGWLFTNGIDSRQIWANRFWCMLEFWVIRWAKPLAIGWNFVKFRLVFFRRHKFGCFNWLYMYLKVFYKIVMLGWKSWN